MNSSTTDVCSATKQAAMTSYVRQQWQATSGSIWLKPCCTILQFPWRWLYHKNCMTVIKIGSSLCQFKYNENRMTQSSYTSFTLYCIYIFPEGEISVSQTKYSQNHRSVKWILNLNEVCCCSFLTSRLQMYNDLKSLESMFWLLIYGSSIVSSL